MISTNSVKKYCKEDPSKIENYDKAIADNTQIWVCHHRDEVRTLPSGMVVYRSVEELIENDRYYNCPANELIFLTRAEHNRVHKKGKKGKITSEFGRKFKEHYGMTRCDNYKFYNTELCWYIRHNHKCRWEVEKFRSSEVQKLIDCE